ncbi:unnamed protein product [Diatraea saccharalis]|uniref:Zinc finger PHD-type domain-containing protein n=1 Tax=Diatraea saccharalis TaxID=40085 RepID=A0A9N9WI62_9NEOP|nr:unnamed protein product [Diatraea saccharalis]
MDKGSSSDSNISLDSLEHNFNRNTKLKCDSPSDDNNIDTILVPFYEKDVLIKVNKVHKKKILEEREHRSRKDTHSRSSYLVKRDVKKDKRSSYLEKFRKQFTIHHNVGKKEEEHEIRSLSPEFGDTERESFGEEDNSPVNEFYETEAYNEMYYDKILNSELENYSEHSFDAGLNLDDDKSQSADENNLKSISEVSQPRRRMRRATVQPLHNMKLGGLGPDMEKIKPRLERARSLQRYSEKVRMENRLKIYKKSLQIELEKRTNANNSARQRCSSKDSPKVEQNASYLVNNSIENGTSKIVKKSEIKPKSANMKRNEKYQIKNEVKKHGNNKQSAHTHETKTNALQHSNSNQYNKKVEDDRNINITKSVRSSARSRGINTDKEKTGDDVPPVQISFMVNVGGVRPSSALRTLEEKHKMYQEQIDSQTCPSTSSELNRSNKNCLVDYSSTDSDTANNNVLAELNRPHDTIRRPIIHSSESDTSITDNYEEEAFILHHRSRLQNVAEQALNVYNSSEDENEYQLSLPQDQGTPIKQIRTSCHNNVNVKTQGSETSNDDDSDYNIPLERLRIKKSLKTPFQKLLSTPNYAVIKQKPRRKAINYKGRIITKDIFTDRENKKERQRNQKASNSGIKKNQKKKKVYNKKTKENHNTIDEEDKWYCYACNEERFLAMRKCFSCNKWFHEECLGLTKKDMDFECPMCN